MSSFVKSLLTVLSVIGLLAWGACVFVGVHFASDCSWPVSISAGVGCALLMGFFFFLACHYSRKQAGSEYGAVARTKKWVFLGIYALLTLCSAWYVLHAVACTTTYKEEIQSKAGEEFQALRAMTADKETTPGSYMEYVNERLIHYRTANPNHQTDTEILDKEVDDLYDLYVTKSNYPQLKLKIRQFGEPASYAVEHWDIFSVSSYLHDLDKKKSSWDTEIAACAENAAELEPANLREPYIPLKPTYTDLATPLLNPSSKGVTFAGILTAVVLQLLILLSWVAVAVSTQKGATGIAHKQGVAIWKS